MQTFELMCSFKTIDESKPLEHENVRFQNKQNRGFQLPKRQDTYLKNCIPCWRFE